MGKSSTRSTSAGESNSAHVGVPSIAWRVTSAPTERGVMAKIALGKQNPRVLGAIAHPWWAITGACILRTICGPGN